MHQVDDCIFCKIIQGKAPCYNVHEDDLTLSFLDIFPSSPGHLLIITKEHFSDMFTATPDALARVAENSLRLANAIQAVFAPDGLGVYQLNKAAAGQTVFHYHMHLIPKMEGQAPGIHSKTAGDANVLQGHAELLRSSLAKKS